MLKNVEENNQNFLLQGSILAIAGLIVRFIGLLYRIPMISVIGTVGHGYYSSAYSVYSIFLILSSYSLPTAISKLVSQRLANERYRDIIKVIRLSFLLSILVGLFMFFIMFFGARAISIILQKEKLVVVLRALAPSLFIMSILSVFRGVFQGMGDMVPTAISQIIEQIFNAIFSVILSVILFSRGQIANLIYETENYEYAFGASGGVIGTGVGAFSALIFLIGITIYSFPLYKRYFIHNNGYRNERFVSVCSSIIKTTIPIIASAFIYNVSSVVDDIVFSNAFAIMGRKEEVVSLWGVYHEYHLLFNIPVAIASSLATSMIPSISSSVAMNNAREVVLKIKYSMKYTCLVVIPCFIGLSTLSDPICRLLFNGDNVETLILLVRFGSIAVVTYAYSTVTIGILQGLGYFNTPVFNSVIALIIHVFLMCLFLFVFSFGIYSVIYANIIFSTIVFILNQMQINKVVRYRKGYIRNYIMPIVCSVIMGIVVNMVYSFFNATIFSGYSQFVLIIKVSLSIISAFIIYIVLILVFGVITRKDTEYIPFIKVLFR